MNSIPLIGKFEGRIGLIPGSVFFYCPGFQIGVSYDVHFIGTLLQAIVCSTLLKFQVYHFETPSVLRCELPTKKSIIEWS